MRFATRLIHNGHAIDKTTGALGTPIVLTSTFAKLDMNADQEFDYARSGNPTRKALEETIAQLEGGAKGYAFASGMAAIGSTLGIFSSGDHIVTAEDIYGGSYRIMNNFYKRWGLGVSAVDSTDLDAIKEAIKPSTKALFLETPSNPLLKITDLKGAIAIAKESGLITIVDNTFLTPYLQRPIALGADIVVHSATKFLGGHSDVVLGLAVTQNEELGRKIYAVQNSFGAIASPSDCFLTIRGIKTLKARLDAEQASAAKLADWLKTRSEVTDVYYPALREHKGREIHEKQADGFGAVLSFKTKNKQKAIDFLGAVKYAAAAVSLGGVETIVSYPAQMSHAAMPQKERERLGITDSLIRISVGLEDIDDLIADFEEALR
ncbi:MAG: PLP-dependent transferase [Helicobacteraceae bacterium]|jgi:cystathionine beta-lyase/cystathionine gamma-synthase|nr:PLP-dependent transferase [Helicobacteraceae bacterium]